MSKFFYLGQYIRHDRNVWYGPQGIAVSERRIIDQLEREYRAFQSHQATGHDPRPAMGVPTLQDAPPMAHKGRVSNREKRQSGRAE